jgi:hypothetical protein
MWVALRIYGFVPNIVLQATGLPLESKAGIQCSLAMKDVSGYSRMAPFSNTYVPLFWLQLVSFCHQ